MTLSQSIWSYEGRDITQKNCVHFDIEELTFFALYPLNLKIIKHKWCRTSLYHNMIMSCLNRSHILFPHKLWISIFKVFNCVVLFILFFSIPTFQSITGFSDPSPKAHSFNFQKLKFKCFLAEYFPRKMKMTYMFCHLSLIFAINFHAYTTFVVLFLLEIITYQALAFEIICYLDCTYYNNHLQVESKMPMCNGIQRYMHCFLF